MRKLAVCCAAMAIQLHAEPTACFEAIHVPRYEYPAWGAQIQGSASARISLVGDRMTVEVEVTHPLLKMMVERSIERWRKRSCGMREVSFRFEFRMEGARSEMTLHDVVFHPPDRFVVIVTPSPHTTKRYTR